MPNLLFVGEAQFITAPVPARLNFNLDPDYDDDDDDVLKGIADSDSRLVSMLAAQEAFRIDGSGLEDEDGIARNPELSQDEKKELLQKALNMAASNGDEARVRRILEGDGKDYVDVNAPDEEGTSPLIYASCFVSFVISLLENGKGVTNKTSTEEPG